MAEFLPWLFLTVGILICSFIADDLVAPEPVVPDPVPDRWVAPDADMLAAWVRADGELASRLRVPLYINPVSDGTTWRVRDHQQRRAVELVNARRGGERR